MKHVTDVGTWVAVGMWQCAWVAVHLGAVHMGVYEGVNLAYACFAENGPDYEARYTARPTLEGQGHGGAECCSSAQL